jgi:hypothetical protein
MADRGTATFTPTTSPHVVADYEPVIAGSGGTPVEPKRFLNVGGTAVAIQ